MSIGMFQTSCVNELGVREHLFDAMRPFRHAYTHAVRELSTFSDVPYFQATLTNTGLPSRTNMVKPLKTEWRCSIPVVKNGSVVATANHLLDGVASYVRPSVQGRFSMMPSTRRIANPLQRLQAMCSESSLLEIHVKEFGWDADPSEWTLSMQAHFETLCHRFPKIMASWLSAMDTVDIEYSGFGPSSTIGVPIVVCMGGIVGLQGSYPLSMPTEYDAFFHAWCMYSDLDIANMQYRSQLQGNAVQGFYSGAVQWPFFVAPDVGAHVQEQMNFRAMMDLPISEKLIVEACFLGIPKHVLPLPLHSHEIDAMGGYIPD